MVISYVEKVAKSSISNERITIRRHCEYLIGQYKTVILFFLQCDASSLC
jgi:hypothetical protein